MYISKQIANRLTLHSIDCPWVVGITLVGRGPEKSCGTRILGLAKNDAVSAQALHGGLSTQFNFIKIISLKNFWPHTCACQSAMITAARARGLTSF